MADTSTKDTLASTKATPVGKNALPNMPLATPANIPIPTLKDIAESLVALEMDLQEAQKNGYRWQMLPLAKNGKKGMAIILYHPSHSISVERQGGNLVATLDGIPAAVLATRKKNA